VSACGARARAAGAELPGRLPPRYWAGEKLDELRRRLSGTLRPVGKGDQAASHQNSADLSPAQRQWLAQIVGDNRELYKAYLMEEQFREVFKAKGEHGKALRAGLIAWCQRCRIRRMHSRPGQHGERSGWFCSFGAAGGNSNTTTAHAV
jgi:Transposase